MDFTNFIEKTKLPKGVILVSVDVMSLYTNILQEEGIFNIVRTAYETLYNETPPIPKTQGMKLTFLARSHLAPKFSKLVAKAKKLGAIKKKDSGRNALYSSVKWKGFPSFEVKRLGNQKGHFTSQYTM